MITAAADGSALGNPGPAGWAWYIDDDNWHAGGWADSTNNRGELQAVIDLLEQTEAVAAEGLHIYCDSLYVVNSATVWIPKWKQKRWRKSDGGYVMNLEMIQQLDELVTGRPLTFEWVKGHAGHPMNERADTLARAAATASQNGTPLNAGPGFTGLP